MQQTVAHLRLDISMYDPLGVEVLQSGGHPMQDAENVLLRATPRGMDGRFALSWQMCRGALQGRTHTMPVIIDDHGGWFWHL
jgi:hypothetical protein